MGNEALSRLREIRRERERWDRTRRERDRLIREAAADGYSVRRIAEASGLSPARVAQILSSE